MFARPLLAAWQKRGKSAGATGINGDPSRAGGEIALPSRKAKPCACAAGARAPCSTATTSSTSRTSAEAVRAEAADVVTRATGGVRRLQHQLKHAPSLSLLERSIGRVVDRLLPREIAQLRRVLTAPQAAIAFKAREAVKDIVLGRGEDER